MGGERGNKALAPRKFVSPLPAQRTTLSSPLGGERGNEALAPRKFVALLPAQRTTLSSPVGGERGNKAFAPRKFVALLPARRATLSSPLGGERGNEALAPRKFVALLPAHWRGEGARRADEGPRCVFLAALLLLLTLPLFANVTSSSLTGRVNVGGKAVGGVTVTAASAALQQPRTTSTDARGRYWIGELPPGEYDVTFSLAGHTTLTRRAILQLARVARADATLEPNADEESVTSTATTQTATETIAVTSHFDDHLLDRLPTGRVAALYLAPGGVAGSTSVDGIATSGTVASEETVEQITVVRAAAPVEWESSAGSVVALRTRSGGDEFFFTLRANVSDSGWNDLNGIQLNNASEGTHVFGEGNVGGRIVPQRLWFFAAASKGEQTFGSDAEGQLLKIDAQAGVAHHLQATYLGSTFDVGEHPFDNDTVALRYTGVAGPRFTAEVLADRTTLGGHDAARLHTEFASGRASYVAGEHVLTAGMTARDSDFTLDTHAFFLSDRWSTGRWNVYAGARYDDSDLGDELTARAAVTYDLRGDGTRAIAASYGSYAEPLAQTPPLRIATLGYVRTIGASGSARIDAMHRQAGNFWAHQLQADARYRLFERFEAGATYTLTNQYDYGFGDLFAYAEQEANVWIGAELPVRAHEAGLTIVQRMREVGDRTIAPTDVAVRYTMPFSRTTVVLAADVTNAFSVDTDPLRIPRAVRVWIRLRS